MTPDIRRTTADCWSYSHLAQALSAVTQVSRSDDSLIQFIRRNDIQLRLSRCWHDLEQRPLGLVLLGVRGEQVWIGALGLAPALRGRALAARLLSEALEPARASGLTRVGVEVDEDNELALRVCRRARFRPLRKMSILDAPECDGYSMEARPQDPAPLPASPGLCWSRYLEPQFCQALAWDDKAWVKFRLEAEQCCLLDTNVPDRAREVTAVLHTAFPGCSLCVHNEPCDSVLHAALEAAGWQVRARQRELTLAL